MIQLKWQWAVMGPVAAFLLGLFCGPCDSYRTNSSYSTYESQRIRDRLDTARSTVYVPLTSMRVQAPANRVRTITIHDTLFTERCLDTLLSTDSTATAPDTLSVCFARNVFSVCVGLSPRRKEVAVPYIAHDTFYSREDTVRMTSSEKRSWFENLLTVLVSVAAGIVIGKL